MTGVIEGIVTAVPEEIKALKAGVAKKSGKPWTLWGTKLEVNYSLYGITAFSKKEVEDRLGAVTVNDRVKIQAVEDRGFLNIVEKTTVQIISTGNSLPPKPKEPEPETPKVESSYIGEPDEKIKKSIQADMEWSFDAAGQVLAFRECFIKETDAKFSPLTTEDEQKIATSLFIELRKVRRGDKY